MEEEDNISEEKSDELGFATKRHKKMENRRRDVKINNIKLIKLLQQEGRVHLITVKNAYFTQKSKHC